jgi:hypothetical protein
LVLSVKVQNAPAHLRGPGCFTKVSYMNLLCGQVGRHMQQQKGHQRAVGGDRGIT